MRSRKSSYSRAWTHDEDATLIRIAMGAGTVLTAEKTLPHRSQEACVKRLRKLRKDGVTTAAFANARPLGRHPTRYSKKWQQSPSAETMNDYRAESDEAAFLADLRDLEKPPVDLEMKPGAQRVMHNPSSFHGSGCGSSAAIASEG